MEDFEFLRNVTVGQYFAGESIVHRIDPRTKITVLIILAMVNSFITSYTGNAILLAVCTAYVIASGISLRFILSGVKPALPIIIIYAIMQLLFFGEAYAPYGLATQIYFEWGIITVSNGSVQLVIVTLMRFLEILFLVSLLTATTTTTDIAHGVEGMLKPFQRLGVPAHEISLIGTISLRFVPIFAEQLEIIMKAQASRGADFGGGGVWQFVKTTRQMVTLVVPLFVDAFRRAEDLILAMEARCYMGGKGRTSITRFRLTNIDYLIMIANLIFGIALIALRNRFPA
jgi:energy-coupling factor transport system permease protein